MKILITGGSGLLALNWAAALRDKATIFLGLHSREIGLTKTLSKQIDINSFENTIRSFESLQPELVVHTAGLASVENCEVDRNTAFHKNVTLAKNVAQACDIMGIKLVHISTDQLFEGSHAFMDEGATPNPKNFYGQTKAEAEWCTLQANPSCLVIRTNFYGWGTPYRISFSDYILQSLRRGVSLELFQDVFYTPILAESLALTATQLATTNVSGIVNLVGDTRVSKFEFGIRIAKEFQFDVKLIRPARLGSRLDLIPRPADMSLDNTKATSLLGKKPSSLQFDLRRLRKQEDEGLTREFASL